jgi:hypothetical protein
MTGAQPMTEPTTETADPLVLDFVEWIAREKRFYSEVVAVWKTSCPRLTIWEDAADRGFVARETVAGTSLVVAVTEGGKQFLRANGRIFSGIDSAQGMR